MATRNVEAEFRLAWTRAGSLPPAAARAYRGRLKGLYVRANGHADIVGADDGYEWSLWLANELDRVFAAVTESADRVYESSATGVQRIVDGTAEAAVKVGFGLWPLAIAAAVVLWTYADSKGAHAR